MKKILLFPLSLLLLFICLSCTRDVILKLDPAPPVLVLNASIRNTGTGSGGFFVKKLVFAG